MEKRQLMGNLAWSLMNQRWKLRLTQKELARQLKISQSKIAYVESGLGNPSLFQIYQMAAFFNVSLDELVKEKPTKLPIKKRENISKRQLAGGSQIAEVRSEDETLQYKNIEIPIKGVLKVPAGNAQAKEILVVHEGSVWVKTGLDSRWVAQNQALELGAHLAKTLYGDDKKITRLTIFRVNPKERIFG